MSMKGQKEEPTPKPPPPQPSSTVNVIADDDDGGGVSPSSASPPQPTDVLYELICNLKWDEASRRCQDRPQDARWKSDGAGLLSIHKACCWGAPLSLVQCLHEAYGEGIRTAANDGSLPMHYACQCGASLEVIRYLHEAYGEGIRKATTYGGQLPLHLACYYAASVVVIQYLHEAYGEGVRTADDDGWLPMHYACWIGASLEVIRYLHGLHPDGATKKAEDGQTPADNLQHNETLSEEYKAAARAILSTSTPPRARTPPPRPTKLDPGELASLGVASKVLSPVVHEELTSKPPPPSLNVKVIACDDKGGQPMGALYDLIGISPPSSPRPTMEGSDATAISQQQEKQSPPQPPADPKHATGEILSARDDPTLLLHSSPPPPFPEAQSIRGTARVATHIFSQLYNSGQGGTSVVQNVLIPADPQKRRTGDGGDDSGMDSTSSSTYTQDNDDGNGMEGVQLEGADDYTAQQQQPRKRAYLLQRVIRDAIYGRVWTGVVLLGRRSPATEQPGAEWQITEERVAIKEMEWSRIRQHGRKLAENPINEVRALKFLTEVRSSSAAAAAAAAGGGGGGAGAGVADADVDAREQRPREEEEARHVLLPMDILSDGLNLYVVSPFCSGGELFDLLPDAGKFSEEEACYWMRQILLGIGHLQRAGISHRNLSPENLLVHDGQFIVIDLGTCLRVPFERQQPTQSQSRDGSTAAAGVRTVRRRYLIPPQGTCGKWHYMSPEILANCDPFDGFAVDLWAAGVILFIMLTGSPPWEMARDSDERFKYMSQGNMAQLLSHWQTGLTAEAMDLLQRMLYKDPRNRLTLRQVLEHPWMVSTTPSTKATAASSGTTHHHGTTSSPTSTQPSTTLPEVDPSSTVSRRDDDAFDDDERTMATAATETALSSHAQGNIEVARLVEEAAAAGDASGRNIEQIEADNREARATTEAEAVARPARRASDEVARRHAAVEKKTNRVRELADAVSQDAKRLRQDAEVAEEAGEDEASGQVDAGRGRQDVHSFSTNNPSERLEKSAPDETSFRLSAARLEAKGLYELHRPAQYDESVPPTTRQLLVAENPACRHHCWEIHYLFDTLLVHESQSETVRDLACVGYIAVAQKHGASTNSSVGTTDSSESTVDSSRGSGGSPRTQGISGTTNSPDKSKLLILRYNYRYWGLGSSIIFVRNERTDHEGKDVMIIKDIDLGEATIGDLKSMIVLKWHTDATDQDLRLLRENGVELCIDANKLKDCNVEEGDTILLRQPRVIGQLDVDQQDELNDWRAKASSGRIGALQLHEVRCRGQSLFDASCTGNFRPGLEIRFLPFYTPIVGNATQSVLEVKVCTLYFGVEEKGNTVFGMKDISSHRGFFVDKVRLSLTLQGDVKPTCISSPEYTITKNTYGSTRISGVALTASTGIDPCLDVPARQGDGTSMATPRTPVHWWIRGDETPQAWVFNRQTWNAPDLRGGHTLYDVMDPRDIRDFKSNAYSGHNKWLERRLIPEVTTTFAPQIRKDNNFLTATWELKNNQDPFRDPENELITVHDRQRSATFKVKLIMGLCEIEIVTLPGKIRQSYEVVKRYREVVINQEVQFAKISSAPKTSPPRSRIIAEDSFDHPTHAPSERNKQTVSLRNSILDREWDALWKALYEGDFDHEEIDKADENGEILLHLACKGDPPTRMVRCLINLCPKLLKQTNEFGELPLHTACANGAHLDIVMELVDRYPESISQQRHGDRKTPLDVAQRYLWTFHQERQTDVICMLRKKGFPKLFRDCKETGLPTKSAFEKWSHIPPPGCTDANAIVLFADISGFKAVNDNEGQQAGDEAIRRYAKNIDHLCQKARQKTEQNKIRSIIDLFRVGGDEFVVVGKFIGKIEDVWDKVFKDLVAMLAELNEQDHRMNPPRFYTFLRVGCAAGEVAIDSIRHILKIAEEKQKDLKSRIDPHRSGKVSLAQIRNEKVPNSSELVYYFERE